MTTHSGATTETASGPTRDVERFRQLLARGGTGQHSYALLLGLKTSDWARLLRSVERGFSFDALEHFQRNVGLGPWQVLEWLQIAPRTLTRRKRDGHLLPNESDRLLRAARILGRSLELFEGDRDGAVEWLLSSQPALGGASPMNVAKTEIGAREVEDLIGRLEHGVYS
ncbi:MAG TPA: antitoxin Xre/MbcA/ParS toxin-binding domain-containing protein [Thermoanaerobaculia bacterium]|jgi:putative toxin-antitoxin system antitoxin component (TIGR02293 family)|nr:antitoxin Xre/MbcA/ParS toxin-binding domain-containing protein [Thermoanaerobaculia bacterium]